MRFLNRQYVLSGIYVWRKCNYYNTFALQLESAA